MLYKRIVIKISGEALGDDAGHAILSHAKLAHIASQVKVLSELGVEVAVVVGAGNIWRGKLASQIGIDRNSGDYMGMLGTIINAVALQSTLTELGVDSRVMSSIEVRAVSEPYIQKRALRHLEKNRVVIFAGGTGNPYFTTDTTASLRAMEIGADAILMAKNGVDGVYDTDPRKNKDAKFVAKISFQQLMENNLQVMDQTAISLLLNNSSITVHVFNMDLNDAIIRVVKGENLGTIIKRDTWEEN